MRPVARPEHALRRRLYQRLRENADVLVARRPALRYLVRRGELHPAAARVDEPEQRLERGMLRRHGLEELADMVDDEAPGEAQDLRFALGEGTAVELHHGVPAECMHARGEPVHHVPAERATGERHEADPAEAAAGAPLQLRGADRW